jgi:hypothetical protein
MNERRRKNRMKERRQEMSRDEQSVSRMNTKRGRRKDKKKMKKRNKSYLLGRQEPFSHICSSNDCALSTRTGPWDDLNGERRGHRPSDGERNPKKHQSSSDRRVTAEVCLTHRHTSLSCSYLLLMMSANHLPIWMLCLHSW